MRAVKHAYHFLIAMGRRARRGADAVVHHESAEAARH